MFQLFLLMTMLAMSMGFVPMSNRFGAGKMMSRTTPKMIAKEGDTVPQVSFKARVRDDTLAQPNPFKWKDVSTGDLFKGKRVVLFALPGGKFSLSLMLLYKIFHASPKC